MNALQENLSPSSCLQFLVLSSHFEESWQFVENPVCMNDEREREVSYLDRSWRRENRAYGPRGTENLTNKKAS